MNTLRVLALRLRLALTLRWTFIPFHRPAIIVVRDAFTGEALTQFIGVMYSPRRTALHLVEAPKIVADKDWGPFTTNLVVGAFEFQLHLYNTRVKRGDVLTFSAKP